MPANSSWRATVGMRPASPGAAPDRFEVRQEIAGDRFTMREVNGAFEGEGELSGDRWRWRAWQSTRRLPDGTRVESVDSLSPTRSNCGSGSASSEPTTQCGSLPWSRSHASARCARHPAGSVELRYPAGTSSPNAARRIGAADPPAWTVRGAPRTRVG